MLATGLLLSTTVLWMATQNPTHQALQRSTESSAVHGNSNNNTKPHIVYEIFAITPGRKAVTLKYGISSQQDFITKPGNPRPEYQVPYYQLKYKKYGYVISYKVLRRNIPGRPEAKRIEREYVNKHFRKWQRKPAEQKRPIPNLF